MGASFSEWLHLFVRWAHILMGIMWIGSSIFFNWLDSHLSESKKKGVEGELWMVHSGGFYQVEKKLVAPEGLPKDLHWFKWEAGFTLLSGLLLLDLVYYSSQGVLTDPSVSSISHPAAVAACVGIMVGTWFLYDLYFISPLAKHNAVGAAVWFLYLAALAYGFSRFLSGRAMFMHVGATMGFCMATSVWVRIIPAQQGLVDAVKANKSPDPELGKKAKQRSRHNNYMTYPVIFIMLSNHFPSAYGSKYAYFILLGLILLGAAIRHFENTGDRSPGWVIAAIVVILVANHSNLTKAPEPEGGADAPSTATASTPAPHMGGPEMAVNPAGVGQVKGTMKYEGPAPVVKEITVPCENGKITSEELVVKDGRLNHVFVWIKKGLESYKAEPPKAEVVVDQRGCKYLPHVTGAMVGQQVTFLNNDSIAHNVRSMTEQNATFNEMMNGKESRLSRTFEKTDIMLRARCDIHPWMAGYVGVVPHPFFAVSDEKGEFTLRNVPEGEYELEMWHEQFGKKTVPLKVGARADVKVDYAFKP